MNTMLNANYKSNHILALNAAFLPSDWISQEEAVKYYAEDQVIGELGESRFVFNGGTGRAGTRSIITVNLPKIGSIFCRAPSHKAIA